MVTQGGGIVTLSDALEAQRFKRWLLTLDPDAVIGRARTPFECPLALYLMAQGGALVYVSHTHCSWTPEMTRRYEEIIAPEWVKRFVLAIDCAHFGAPTTVSYALSTLAMIDDRAAWERVCQRAWQIGVLEKPEISDAALIEAEGVLV